MALDIPIGVLASIASGVLFLGLAAFVASVRPVRAANVAFAAFAGSFGVQTIGAYAGRLEALAPYWGAIAVTAGLGAGVAAVAVFALAATFPHPLRADERKYVPPVLAAILLATVIGVVSTWNAAPAWAAATPEYGGASASEAVVRLNFLPGILLFSALLGAPLLFALRYRRAQDPRTRSQFALMSVAHGLFIASGAGAFLIDSGPTGPAYAATMAALLLAAVVVWIANSALPEGRGAWRVGVALLSFALAGEVVAAAAGNWEATTRTGLYGIARTLEVVVVAYAILRHQMFGIDLKVKWGIRQSTIGAAFIAVFFVVSEAAQNLFSDATGPYIGVVAAGALVFALAPLQRVAERVANAAMPNVPDPSTPLPSGAAAGAKRPEAYRLAVELALGDGVISRAEERTLAKLAKECGLDPEEALAVREEVEARLAPSPTPV